MKIVAGKYGGRRLIAPKNRDIRPTSDKVRGAIFNMLASRGALEGACVLDAFCGTGALGLEALSRGAERCVFMDKSRPSLALARENADLFGVGGAASYVCMDARTYAQRGFEGQNRSESVHQIGQGHDTNLKSEDNVARAYGQEKKKYSLIFLDPPYHKGLITETVPLFIEGGMVYDKGWIVCESEREFSIPHFENVRIDSEKIYGETKVVLLQYDGAYSG